jgi:hypothetical protein
MYPVHMLVVTLSLYIAQTNRFAGPLLRNGTTREETQQDGEEEEGHPSLYFST